MPKTMPIHTKQLVKKYQSCLLTHAQDGIASLSQSPKTSLVLILDPLDLMQLKQRYGPVYRPHFRQAGPKDPAQIGAKVKNI
jgi:hypothetical protein